MKTIERYVFGSFLSSFILAFLVLSFVLTIGLLVQIVSYIMDGVPLSLVGEFCLVSLPETLQWSVPLAILVSSILVFSRLSADSEIAAMRACGIHLMRVVRLPLLFGLACAMLGFFVNNEIVPRGHHIRRTLKKRVSVGAGLSILEPGRMIDDFPDAKLYFASKDGNWLHDLVVADYSNEKSVRVMTAEKALVTQDGGDVKLDLYQMTVDPLDENHPTMARFGRFSYVIKDVFKTGRYRPTHKDMTTTMLFAAIAETTRQRDEAAGSLSDKTSRKFVLAEDVSSLWVEFSKRAVFALASVCFVLVGIPLGIRSQRKESTIGMAISLAVALGYYLVVILMLSLEEKFIVYPGALMFLPVVVCLALSVHFFRKHL